MSNKACWISIAMLAALLTWALNWPAWAADTGLGVVCDTAQQAEEFVILKGGQSAVETINAEKSNACAIVVVAFDVVSDIANVRTENGTWVITQIRVIAWREGPTWHQLQPPLLQYTVFLPKGEGV